MSKLELIKINGKKCFYCGVERFSNELTIDHIIPQSLGGSNNQKNMVLSCVTCNQMKGCLTFDEFIAKIERIVVLRGSIHEIRIVA